MIVKIYKEDVIDGLQKAASVIPQKTGAAYLRSIWLKAEKDNLEFLATDTNVEFRGLYTAEIQEPGFVGVHGRSFVELIRRLPEGQISLRLDENGQSLHVEQGRRKYKIPTNDATWFQKFSEFPEEGAVLWTGEVLGELIEKLSYCIADDEMDALACLIIKPGSDNFLEAAGMNNHQFAMMRYQHDELRTLLPENGILMQKKYLGELKKWLGNDEIYLNLDEKRLFLRTENKKEYLSIPLSSYEYPDYHAFLGRLDEPGASLLTMDRGEALSALTRIAIFNSIADPCTYFELSQKEAVLSAQGQEKGSANESLDVSYDGDLDRIAFPTSNLLTILDHFSSGEITMTITGAEGPCGMIGVNDPGYTVIVMPMKIVDDTLYSEEPV